MSLQDFGWCAFFAAAFSELGDPDLQPGRVVLVHRDLFVVQGEQTQIRARISGRLRQSPGFPVIGDWVAWDGTDGGTNLIHGILPRKSLLARKAPGTRTEQQVVAANIDTAFLVMGLDRDFNLRRMERMVTMVYESGAEPVIVLTKADLADDAGRQALAVEEVAPGIRVLPVSSYTGDGIEEAGRLLAANVTVVFLGSSGVGKSTLINRLFGEEIARTAEVRAKDQRGRHTTTHRQMFRHPAGALLIDNPGIRELQLWGSEEALDASFEDIERLAGGCRFRDCKHMQEPGCAVLAALDDGTLDPARLESYHKLAGELRYLALKQDEGAARAQKQRWKVIHKAARKFYKEGW